MPDTTPPGTLAWADLTVSDAEGIRDFYSRVVGWIPEEVDMEGYSDFTMTVPATGNPAVGICHARGVNSDVPSVWMVYLVVADLEESLSAVRDRGGVILAGPRRMGPGSAYAVIRDPAGAVAALWQGES